MRALLLGVLAALGLVTAAAAREPDLKLQGTMTGADHETYREVPFQVPAGLSAITVEFDYTGREDRSVIDLGLRDPARFRGWSGGNKARFTLSETYATPSYLPGPLPAGEWKLVLGVPNMRKASRADYVARIYFERAFQGFAATPLKTGPAWYRGDLHLHTGHSDGSCPSRTGKRTPCPLFKTLEAAAARGLDFVAVTEHNATSHHQDLAGLQPYFDDLLLIPGREITTFHGHANVFGAVAPLDFQLGGPRAPDLGAMLDQVEAAGGLLSINHPAAPSGEQCMGCGWTAKTDFARIPTIEAVNGGSVAQTGSALGPMSGIPFWEVQLDAGRRITAIGGSDNHDPTIPPDRAPAVGVPTTVVFAEELSQPAILKGIRSGRVFVDVQGTKDRLLDVEASAGGAPVPMGGALEAKASTAVRLSVKVKGAAGGRLAFAGPAARGLASATPLSADDARVLELAADGRAAWLRVDVHGPDGSLWLLGNSIYLNRPKAMP